MNETIPHQIGQGYWACRGDNGIWEVRKDIFSGPNPEYPPFDDNYNGMSAHGRATTLEKAKALCKAACLPCRDQLLKTEQTGDAND